MGCTASKTRKVNCEQDSPASRMSAANDANTISQNSFTRKTNVRSEGGESCASNNSHASLVAPHARGNIPSKHERNSICTSEIECHKTYSHLVKHRGSISYDDYLRSINYVNSMCKYCNHGTIYSTLSRIKSGTR